MHTACGIILKREDFRERDERIVLYTKEFGKLSVVAKGTKRIEAKLRGNLDIFNFVDIIFVEGAHFFILTGVETRERFLNLIKDPYIYGAAVSCARSVVDIFEENVKDKEFFKALNFTIKKLDEYTEPLAPALYAWLLLKKFQMTILENQGYASKEPIEKLSKNATLLLGMLRGQEHPGVRLKREEFSDIEKFFGNTFAYFFNHRISPWIPIG